jgi:hypothetical protein
MPNKAIKVNIISYEWLNAKPKGKNYGKDENISFWVLNIESKREKNHV